MDARFTVEQQQLLMKVGAVLVTCQVLERPLDVFCELASSSRITSEILGDLDAEARRRTVGQMLQKLRAAVGIDPEIDDMLQRFLDDRNALVHRLESAGRSLETPEGRRMLDAFLNRLLGEIGWLTVALPGLLLAFARHAGLEKAYTALFEALPREHAQDLDRFEFVVRKPASS